jgi:hypothetical protein
MEIIDQNLSAYPSGGNCAGDHDLSRYDKANDEGVDCGGKPPSHRFRERAAMSFLALKAAHGNLHQRQPAVLQFFMGFNRRKMEDQRREAV